MDSDSNGATISPFRQDPLSRLRVRVHTALAILEDGSYGLLKYEDADKLLLMALDDIAELEGTKRSDAEMRASAGLDWNEHAALVEAAE